MKEDKRDRTPNLNLLFVFSLTLKICIRYTVVGDFINIMKTTFLFSSDCYQAFFVIQAYE